MVLKNPNAYLSDKIKIYIDGVAINNEIAGSSNFYMDFPMQLVDKIEVLRGPGSALYGAGAFYATVNIITKMGNSKKENQIFVGMGSYNYFTTGANVHVAAGDWDLFSDGYYQQNQKRLHIDLRNEQTDEVMQDLSVGFKAQNGNFEFQTRFKHNISGNFYGFEGVIDDQQNQEHINTYFFTQLAYKADFNGFNLNTKASFSHRELDVGANIEINEAKFNSKFAVVGVNDMNDSFAYNENSHEQNFEIESILTLPKIASNDILIGIGARQVNVTYDNFESSIEGAIAANKSQIENHVNFNQFDFNADSESAYWANPTTTLLKANTQRTIAYTYIQDLITVTDSIDLILGLRADHYSDFGLQLSKRAGLVYRANEKYIFKLLYGSAFRAPTLIEAYQNGHINFVQGMKILNLKRQTLMKPWLFIFQI